MTFKIGMKVVCVDASPVANWAGDPLVEGAIYVVRNVGYNKLTGSWALWLSGMTNRMRRKGIDDLDAGYRASRFRPAVSPKQQVSFTAGAPLDSDQWDNRRKRVEVVS